MNFEYAPEHEAFRKAFRSWLAATLPADLRVDDPVDDRVASNREMFERRVAWQKAMHKAGWVGIAWPKEYGGRGASIIERVIWDEEYSAARAPVLPGMGLNLVGPTIIHWGTDAQKHRYLPRILNAEEIWAQGFSEPGAGSDLASLSTRAEDRRDHFRVNGQQVGSAPAWDDPRIRQRLSQLYIDCEAMKYTRFRALTRQIRGEPPGPEGSILKLSGSELGVRIADAAGELLGVHALVNQGSEPVPDAPRWCNRLVAARQYTISAGTSEIQRNILGERVLGLPKG